MNYRKPDKVLSPKDAVKAVNVLYDGGEDSISVAKIKWYDKVNEYSIKAQIGCFYT